MNKRYVIRFMGVTPLVMENGHRTTIRAMETWKEAGFELNQFGHIRSDFATLVETQSVLVMQQAANRLRELKAIEPDNSKKSFDEIIREIRPRWCQSPKEVLAFEDWLIAQNISGLEDVKADIEKRRLAADEAKRVEDANKAVALAAATGE